MDNLTHTLLGLTLAKAGLERATPLATATLVIASNLPDIDSLMRLRSAFADLETHRGFTHSLVGLPLLAALLTFLLVFLDKRFRLRHDIFRRPIRPLRIFALACLGGLFHVLLDSFNTYGVRPLVPFSERWFYGDLLFVIDPWVWLLLGGASMWLTANSRKRVAVWVLIGIAMSLAVAFALSEPSPRFPIALPMPVRLIWFAGLTLVVGGAVLSWGRAGERVARYAILIFALYVGAMWFVKQTALEQVRTDLPDASVRSATVWPTPANPLVWQAVAAADEGLYSKYADLAGAATGWTEAPVLEARFVDALRAHPRTRVFMNFARYTVAQVEEREDGYTVTLRDIRFDLNLRAELDRDLAVKVASLRWF